MVKKMTPNEMWANYLNAPCNAAARERQAKIQAVIAESQEIIKRLKQSNKDGK